MGLPDNVFKPKPDAGGKKAGETVAPSVSHAGEVVLTLGDILARIPAHFLRAGPPDLKRQLRFAISALSADIAHGRAVVPLSTIAAMCPEIFHSEIGELDDMGIHLPLQKVVEQIGLLDARAQPAFKPLQQPVKASAPPTPASALPMNGASSPPRVREPARETLAGALGIVRINEPAHESRLPREAPGKPPGS